MTWYKLIPLDDSTDCEPFVIETPKNQFPQFVHLFKVEKITHPKRNKLVQKAICVRISHHEEELRKLRRQLDPKVWAASQSGG